MSCRGQVCRRGAPVRTAADIALRCTGLLAAVLLLLSLLGGIFPGAAQEVSIKILVNDDPISDYDIDQRTRFLAITTQQQPNPALKKQAMDMLIDERLQLQEARKGRVTPDEGDVTKILEGMAQKNNLSVDGLATALGKAGVNIKTLKDRIRSQLAWQATVQGKFRRDVRISDSEIDKAMSDAGGEAAVTENTLQLRQVRFEIPAGADQRTIATRLAAAENLRARFGSCAELTKSVNGASVKTLQDQKPASLAQPARLLVMNAKVGQMTPPTITQAAVELYAVCGKQSAKGDEDARQEAERKLLTGELSIRAERLLRDIRQEAFIEYR
jgi:peptidyl-prolyl cis-trans isomerase SurA